MIFVPLIVSTHEVKNTICFYMRWLIRVLGVSLTGGEGSCVVPELDGFCDSVTYKRVFNRSAIRYNLTYTPYAVCVKTLCDCLKISSALSVSFSVINVLIIFSTC